MARNRSACRAQSRANVAVKALDGGAVAGDADMRQPRNVAQSVVRVGPPRRWTMFVAVVAIGRSERATDA